MRILFSIWQRSTNRDSENGIIVHGKSSPYSLGLVAGADALLFCSAFFVGMSTISCSICVAGCRRFENDWLLDGDGVSVFTKGYSNEPSGSPGETNDRLLFAGIRILLGPALLFCLGRNCMLSSL